MPATGVSRRAVLRALKSCDHPVTLVELSDMLSLHINTVRFHLDTLAEAGQVTMADPRRTGPGRPAARYQAAPGGDSRGVRYYRVFADALLSEFRRGSHATQRALSAGRAWGSQLRRPARDESAHPLFGVLALLQGLGFEPLFAGKYVTPPDVADEADSWVIEMHHCPFLELVDEDHLVCEVHRGMLEGALTAWGESVRIADLEPFARPRICLAHVKTIRPSNVR